MFLNWNRDGNNVRSREDLFPAPFLRNGSKLVEVIFWTGMIEVTLGREQTYRRVSQSGGRGNERHLSGGTQ
jgi:hypothetical protein